MQMMFHNRTRRSRSIPLSLLRRGRVLELPIYYLLRASDLAREGLDHSGSFRFADHIYVNASSGRGVFGRWLDARLLGLPAVRSFRNRYFAARDELARFLTSRARAGQPLDILSVPCGIPRELAEGARLARAQGAELSAVTFHGLDLDPEVLALARAFARDRDFGAFVAHQGDALVRASYPDAIDYATCTGLAEFLDDERLGTLLAVLRSVLRPGGRLLITGMRRVALSGYLLRLAELDVHYRTAAELARLVAAAGFARVEGRGDALGIQAIVTADT